VSDLLDLPPEAPRRRRPRHGLRLTVVLVVLVGLLASALVGGRLLLDRLGGDEVLDYDGAGTGRVVVAVEPGQTAAQVGRTLADKDVVRSVAAFNQAALAEPQSRTLQPGSYALRLKMSGQAALARLLDPAARVQGTVVVPEGFRVEQTLERIAARTDIPLAQLRAAAARPQALGLPAYARGRLEGFLFPATYEVEPGTTAVEVLTTMVQRYEQAATKLGLEQKARALGRTPYQVLTVASLIEREVRFDDELPKVAQVVYNRLEQGERLDIDAAVLYGLGRTSGGLTQSDLDQDTPYNLRKIKGLPPTPISSPGEKTLRAALNPTGGDILFYVLSTKEGRSTFTTTLAAHNRAVAKARRDGIF
jgi:UPF0755 protein